MKIIKQKYDIFITLGKISKDENRQGYRFIY